MNELQKKMTSGGTKKYTYSLEHIEHSFFNFDNDGSEDSVESHQRMRGEWKKFRLMLHQLSTGHLGLDSDQPKEEG